MTTLAAQVTAPAAVARVSAWANAEIWDREYGVLGAIPSSHRLTPSHAFRALESALRLSPGMTVLDAGCGTGRHALYLAAQGIEVHAVDTSEVACSILRERLRGNPDLAKLVHVEHARLDPRDVPADRYDAVIDSYVSCHLLDTPTRLSYLDELLTATRPGGVLYTATMGADDSYYRRNTVGLESGLPLAVDPLNGIPKLLQKRRGFAAPLRALGFAHEERSVVFSDEVAGRTERREVLAAVIRR